MGAVTPDRYREVIDDVLVFLGGHQDAMLDRVEVEMRRSADLLDFERSARLRDVLRQARQVMVSQQLLTGAVERNNLIIVCPGAEAGSVELFGIRHGRLFEQQTLGEAPDATLLPQVSDFLQRLQNAASRPPIVGQEEIDAIIIIGRWLERYGESRHVIRLPDTLDANTAPMVVSVARHVAAEPATAAEGSSEWDE
jgi:excinuclease UvrABC nuclease subunit